MDYISKKFDYQGFKYEEFVEGFHIFRRQTLEGKIQTVKATPNDMDTGFIYRMIDSGLTRF